MLNIVLGVVVLVVEILENETMVEEVDGDSRVRDNKNL